MVVPGLAYFRTLYPKLSTQELTEAENLAISRALQNDRLDILNLGDSKALNLGSSHNSWYSHPWVSNDLMLLMLFNLSPTERGLEKYDLDNGEIGFYFPKDYEQRIRDIIRINKENMVQGENRKKCLKLLQFNQKTKH